MADKSQVVGKVAIKVVPHTGDFRDTARKELRKVKLNMTAMVAPELHKASVKRTKDRPDRTFGEIKSTVTVSFDETTLQRAV